MKSNATTIGASFVLLVLALIVVQLFLTEDTALDVGVRGAAETSDIDSSAVVGGEATLEPAVPRRPLDRGATDELRTVLRVMDAQTRVPIASARIYEMNGADSLPSVSSDSEGMAPISGVLSNDESRSFAVVAHGYAVERLVPSSVPGREGEWTIDCQPARSLRGRLINIDAALAAAHRFELRCDYRAHVEDAALRNLAAGRRDASAVAEASGAFALSRVIDASTTLRVVAVKRSSGVEREIAESVVARTRDYVEIDLTGVSPAPDAGELRLTMQFLGDRPVGQVRLTAFDEHGELVPGVNQVRVGRSVEEARIVATFGPLLPARYVIEAAFERQGMMRLGPFQVDGITHASVNVGIGGVCRATVRGAPKVDLRTAPVSVHFQTIEGHFGGVAYAKSAADPVATIESLPAGRYLVHAQATSARMRAQTQEIDVSDGQVLVLEFDLAPAHHVSFAPARAPTRRSTFTVFDASERPVQRGVLLPNRGTSGSILLCEGSYTATFEPNVRSEPITFQVPGVSTTVRVE